MSSIISCTMEGGTLTTDTVLSKNAMPSFSVTLSSDGEVHVNDTDQQRSGTTKNNMTTLSCDSGVGWAHLSLRITASNWMSDPVYDAEANKNKWTMLPGTSIICPYQTALNWLSDSEKIPETSNTGSSMVESRTENSSSAKENENQKSLIRRVQREGTPIRSPMRIDSSKQVANLAVDSISSFIPVTIQQGTKSGPKTVIVQAPSNTGALFTLSEEQKNKISMTELHKLVDQRKLEVMNAYKKKKFDEELKSMKCKEKSNQIVRQAVARALQSTVTVNANVTSTTDESHPEHTSEIDSFGPVKTRELFKVLQDQTSKDQEKAEGGNLSIKRERDEFDEESTDPIKRSRRESEEQECKTNKQRRKRTCFKADKLEYLEKMFDLHNHFPRREDHEDMAKTMNVSIEAVKHWFKNRRQKFRKEHEDEWSDLETHMDFLSKYRVKKKEPEEKESNHSTESKDEEIKAKSLNCDEEKPSAVENNESHTPESKSASTKSDSKKVKTVKKQSLNLEVNADIPSVCEENVTESGHKKKKGTEPDKIGDFSDDEEDTPKRKRLRTNFNEEQIEYLERIFNYKTQFPNMQEREEIAYEIGLTLRAVINWFQNRRQKHRKDGFELSQKPEDYGKPEKNRLKASPKSTSPRNLDKSGKVLLIDLEEKGNSKEKNSSHVFFDFSSAVEKAAAKTLAKKNTDNVNPESKSPKSLKTPNAGEDNPVLNMGEAMTVSDNNSTLQPTKNGITGQIDSNLTLE